MGRLMTSVMTTGTLEPISFTSLRSFTHSVTTTVPVIRLSLDAAEHAHLRPALSVLGPPERQGWRRSRVRDGGVRFVLVEGCLRYAPKIVP